MSGLRVFTIYERNLACNNTVYTKWIHKSCTLSVKSNLRNTLAANNYSNASSEFRKDYLNVSDECKTEFKEAIVKSMTVIEDFVSRSEELSIFNEIEPYLKNLHYEFDHWDNAIHGYRETERLQWNEDNMKILDKVRKFAFPPDTTQLHLVHVLDLAEEGHIKPHVDSVRFCGDTIAGLSLLSDSVMRLIHEKNHNNQIDVLLKRRSLYIMRGTARYECTHEILSNKNSVFRGQSVHKKRRISVICRNEPIKE